MPSVAERLASLPPEDRAKAIAALSNEEAEALLHDWRGFLARPEQIAPGGDWDIWLLLAGRGFGKTRTGAEWTREQSKTVEKIALVAETAADARDVMVEELLRIHPRGERPVYTKSTRCVEFQNGARAFTYNAVEPDQLRGPQHGAAWSDEIAKWRYARETWDQLQFGLRLGKHPRQAVTTTPRPIELVKEMVAGKEGKVVVTRGSTLDNKSNLSGRFMDRIYTRYAGTRLGRQELNAEILGDIPGAIWRQQDIDAFRVSKAPEVGRVVVSVDPAVTNEEDSNEHGIAVAGKTADNEGVLLADESMAGTPAEWAGRAVALYDEYQADAVVAEVNQGGDMVKHTIQTIRPNINVIEVRATRGKHVRAEPIASLYQQGRIKHVGQFPELETQMTQMTTAGFEGDGSPDRVDALVWAFTELFPDIAEPVEPVAKIKRRGRAGGWMGS